MEGRIYFIEGDSQSQKVQAYNELVGRVSTIRTGSYYYPGLLDNHKFFLLGNGCYFVAETKKLPYRGRSVKATISLKKSEMVTAKEHYRKLHKDKKVLRL